MEHSQTEMRLALPRAAFQEIMLALRKALPSAGSGSPADAARRDRAALAGVATLQPGNAAEGRMAAQFVAADAWASECFRLAQEAWREPELALIYQGRAARFLRESKSSLRLLWQMQAMRRAAAADAPAADRAPDAGEDVMDMMAEALAVEPAAADMPDIPPGGTVSTGATPLTETRAETMPGFAPIPEHLRVSPFE
jgi:hypothetical protein